jgi:hypothetical protein
MPYTAHPRHLRPFNPRQDLAQRLSEICGVLEHLRHLDVHRSTKKELIDRAIWLVAELSGNFTPRYRSEGVLKNLGVKIRRDHIHPRSTLIERLLCTSEPAPSVVKDAVCCLVTVDEHLALSRVPSGIIGFERYRCAEVVVRDMSTYVYPPEA